jgi:hypothetical protein
MSKMLQTLKFAMALSPVADGLDGTKRSDVYSLRDHGRILFVVAMGVATGGTATTVLTVNACDNVTPSNRTAIPFYYREIIGTGSIGDTDGAITRAAAAGFTTTAGGAKLVLVEADAKDLPTNYGFVELTSIEGVNDPVVTSIVAILGGAPSRYTEDVNATAIV